jgi:outer membrane biosynthesis protein TonB
VNLSIGAIFSGVLHLAVILIAWLGLPELRRKFPEIEPPIIVEVVNIAEVSNPPPLPTVQTAPPKAAPEPPKPEPKPEPPKPEPPKPEPPPPPPPPKPEPPPPTPAPKPEPKPEVSPLAELKPKPKPEPPKEDFSSVLKNVDKLKKDQPKPDNFDDVMKKLAQNKPAPPKPQEAPPAQVAKAAGSPSHRPSEPISVSELDAIRAQVERCWNFDPGARDADKLVAEVRVKIDADGTVTSAEILDIARIQSDSFLLAMANASRRSLLACSPLKVPASKHELFKDTVFKFNPRGMLGR